MKTIKISIEPYAKNPESVTIGKLTANSTFLEEWDYNIMDDKRLKVRRKCERAVHHYTIEIPEGFQYSIAKRKAEWQGRRQNLTYEVVKA